MISLCVVIACLGYLSLHVFLPWTMAGRQSVSGVDLLKAAYKDPGRLLEFFVVLAYLASLVAAWAFTAKGLVTRSRSLTTPLWFLTATAGPVLLLLSVHVELLKTGIEALAPPFYLGPLAGIIGLVASLTRLRRA